MAEAVEAPVPEPCRIEECALPCCLGGALASWQRLSGSYPEWLFRCASCGLVCTHPQPDDVELADIYNADYFLSFGYGSRPDAYRRMKRAGFQRLLNGAERFVSPGRLLDVGSGLGDLMFVARARGWIVTGIEPIALAAEQADEFVPGATICGNLDDSGAPENTFDLITCTDVFEHLRRPAQVLRQMRKLLRSGGCLLLTTVNVDSWPARCLGSRWPHFHRDHLWYFNRQTLTRFVESADLAVLHWAVPRKVFSLSYVLSILASYGPHSLTRRVATGLLHQLPNSVLCALWPALPEGQLLVARKQENSS